MPQLTFPILPDGLCVDVTVNFPGAVLAPLHAQGQPTPPSFRGRGLIDTGSDITVVSLFALQQLGIPPLPFVSTQAISGTVKGQLFHVSLGLYDANNVQGSWFVDPSIQVMGLTFGGLFDVVIGMDILLQCRLTVDGPPRLFTIEF